MKDRQKNESPEHPGVNDNLETSTERPERKFLDVHGMRPSSSRNAKILSGARPGKE